MSTAYLTLEVLSGKIEYSVFSLKEGKYEKLPYSGQL